MESVESIQKFDDHQSMGRVDDYDCVDDQSQSTQSDVPLHYKFPLPRDYLDLDMRSHDDPLVLHIPLQVMMLLHCEIADEAVVSDDADVSDSDDGNPECLQFNSLILL